MGKLFALFKNYFFGYKKENKVIGPIFYLKDKSLLNLHFKKIVEICSKSDDIAKINQELYEYYSLMELQDECFAMRILLKDSVDNRPLFRLY